MDKQKFIESQLRSIKKLCELHEKIKDTDESLKSLQPIAVVDNSIFYVFDINQQCDGYEFIKEYPSPNPLPEGLMAAFPLDFYENKPAAVISAKGLENPVNYVFVYHEFVHCYQWKNFEQNIRRRLRIEKQQMKENNFMWELNYPFPYGDDVFIKLTGGLNKLQKERRLEAYTAYHQEMKKHLSETDFEYMLWQEWKEGFARYAENLVRKRLGMKENSNELSPPYDRRCFYELGCKYIQALRESDNATADLEKLFLRMSMLTLEGYFGPIAEASIDS